MIDELFSCLISVVESCDIVHLHGMMYVTYIGRLFFFFDTLMHVVLLALGGSVIYSLLSFALGI